MRTKHHSEIKMMQMISHRETTLPFRRRCVERVRGVSFGGARLWKAWQPALCHCRHDAVKVSHQCAHFVLQISENIKSHLHTSAYCRLKCSQYVRGGGWFAMHVLAVLWPWTWAAVMVDRFGFLWRSVERREEERRRRQERVRRVSSFVTNGEEIWIFSQLIKPINIYPAKGYVNLADKLIQNIFLSLEMVEELGLTSQLPNRIWRASHPDTTQDTRKGMNGKDVSKWH